MSISVHACNQYICSLSTKNLTTHTHTHVYTTQILVVMNTINEINETNQKHAHTHTQLYLMAK